MRRMHLFAGVLLVILVAASGQPAAAAERGWYVSALGGVGRFSDRLRFPSASRSTAPLVGARLSRALNDYWSFEIGGAYAFASGPSIVPPAGGSAASSDDATLLNVSGTLLYTLVEGRYGAPYLGAGGGYNRYRYGFGSPDLRAGTFELAFGWKGRLNDRVGLRFEARNVLGVSAADPTSSNRAEQHFLGGLTLNWGGRPNDSDGDGVPDRVDREPHTPKGARVDQFGVAIDSDGDGVPDGLDRNSDTPRGALVDQWGVPSDTDHDGVYDGLDKCPDTPAGVLVDANGCPKDSDGDGVYDGLDKCPDTPAGVLVDANGCPKDSDGDGVFDGMDKCPGTDPGLKVDAAGCPIEVIEREEEMLDTGKLRLQNINFETGKAELPPASLPAIDAVGQLLLAWPQLRLEVGGHTDSRGDNATNIRLSEARARAVLDRLTEKYPNVLVERFTVKGYGKTKPIAPNASAAGMAKNRRVEFVILNQEALKKEVERRRLLRTGESPAPASTPADTTKKQ